VKSGPDSAKGETDMKPTTRTIATTPNTSVVLVPLTRKNLRRIASIWNQLRALTT